MKQNEAVIFDTLSYSKELQAAGFTPEQAEVQARTFLRIVEDRLVSKRDLKELENELKHDIASIKKETQVEIEKIYIEIANVKKDLELEIAKVKSDLKLDIENVRKDLMLEIEGMRKDTRVNTELLRRDLKIWFGGMLVAAVSVLSGIMTLVVHLAH